MKKISKLLIVFFLTNCNQSPHKSGYLDIPPETGEVRKVSSLVKDVTITPLIGDLGNLPYEADKISVTDDLILIGDFNFSQSLFAFDRASGETLEVPIRKGEGPYEVKEVDDFWVEGNQIYVLDGIGRKVIPLSYWEKTFEIEDPIRLEVLTQRFAKTKTGFVALTGGGQDNELVFFNKSGKVISSHLPHSIAYLMKPLNPFHKLHSDDRTIFHSSFEPVFYQVEQGELNPLDTLAFQGKGIQSPKNTDFVMDLDGFNQFRESLRNQPSMFSVFESTGKQTILFYFYSNKSYFALFSEEKNISIQSENLVNDLSFDYEVGFPIAKGVSNAKFLASIIKEQVNQEHPNFEGSELQKAIIANPLTEVFLLEFSLDLKRRNSD